MSLAPPKRSSSPRLSFPLNGEPPYKRAKTDHPPNSLSDAPCGVNSSSAAVALSPNIDCSSHPLTSPAANAVCGPIQPSNDPQAPGQPPQSLLSWCAVLHHHQLPQGSVDYAVAFGNSISRSRTSATRRDDYISSNSAMNNHFGPEVTHLSYPDGYAVADNRGKFAPQSEVLPCSADFPKFFWEGFDNMGVLLPSCSFVEPQDPLSLCQDYNLDMTLPVPPSPLSRSMSRSSFCSSSVLDEYSPYGEDYPTPASDTTAVTTPAPSEACIGSPSEFAQVLFGQDFSSGLEAKKGEHELSYVAGSAPLSPNALPFDFGRMPEAIAFSAASATNGGLAGIRRHSEPASLAACHFPPFFVSVHEALARGVLQPADFVTHPITDNLLSSSPASASHSALLSSIAPHQTQLQRPLEIQHPKPVRAFKPPILVSGHQYDPQDFVRRRSEPFVALPQFDVFSHLPTDDVQSDEEEDAMDTEDGSAYEHDDTEYSCNEQSVDGNSFQDTMMDFWTCLAQGGQLFDLNRPWIQSHPGHEESTSTLSAIEMFEEQFDWTHAALSELTDSPRLDTQNSWDGGFSSL